MGNTENTLFRCGSQPTLLHYCVDWNLQKEIFIPQKTHFLSQQSKQHIAFAKGYGDVYA